MRSLYQKLVNKPVQFMRFTGFYPGQFNEYAANIKPMWVEFEKKRLSSSIRMRNIGAGHPYHLSSFEDMLLLTLVFYRTYATHFFLGWLFGFDGSNAGRLVRKMTNVIVASSSEDITGVLKNALKIRKDKRISSWSDFSKEFPDLVEVIIDATEQPVKKPAKVNRKNKYRSGKVKRHTLKTQIVISKTGKILDVSKTYPGGVHDKKVLIDTGVELLIPKETRQFLDRGYEGLLKEFPKSNIRLPYKRYWKQGNKLTRGKKQANTLRSKRRIGVEHTFARLKKYQLLSQTYRSDISEYNNYFRAIVSLVNARQIFREMKI